MTNTSRTLELLRGQGMTCGMVERFNRFGGPHGIRQDLFGFIDIIAICRDRGIIGVQSTGQDFAGHERKILIEKKAEAMEWLLCGGKIELYGWTKRKRKTVDGRWSVTKYWTPRRREFFVEDFE